MSGLIGHAHITYVAVRELSEEMRMNPVVAGVWAVNLAEAAVCRDILDFLNTGHWADFGQKHHFMRKFDQQSQFEAYADAVDWIRTNAMQSARNFAAGVITWQSLGNAVHALEDSFATGHVEREEAHGERAPGRIKRVKRYSGADKEGHAEGDDAWSTNGVYTTSPTLSLTGRLAKEAVKALLRMVLKTANTNPLPAELVGWRVFQDQWIQASPDLDKAHDHVFELIDAYSTGIRHGATNIKTLNMDEAGLANALLKENSSTTLDVFRRLDDQFNSDVDDVAEIYVNLIKSRGAAAASQLKSNPELVKLLIKVMDEGWTSSGEKKCIAFLKSL